MPVCVQQRWRQQIQRRTRKDDRSAGENKGGCEGGGPGDKELDIISIYICGLCRRGFKAVVNAKVRQNITSPNPLLVGSVTVGLKTWIN